jgi:hypothetical protein
MLTSPHRQVSWLPSSQNAAFPVSQCIPAPLRYTVTASLRILTGFPFHQTITSDTCTVVTDGKYTIFPGEKQVASRASFSTAELLTVILGI